MVNNNKLDENIIFVVNIMHMSNTCSEFSLDLTLLVDGMGGLESFENLRVHFDAISSFGGILWIEWKFERAKCN